MGNAPGDRPAARRTRSVRFRASTAAARGRPSSCSTSASRSSVCRRPSAMSDCARSSASERVMRPRRTASSSVSRRRSVGSITARPSSARSAVTPPATLSSSVFGAVSLRERADLAFGCGMSRADPTNRAAPQVRVHESVRSSAMTRTFSVAAALVATLAFATPALAAFPYEPQGPPSDYSSYRLPPDRPVPDDLSGKRVWMYASTADPTSPYQADRRELNGVRGAHIVDADRQVAQAWETTTGRPDVTIAILDSGIKWNDDGIMADTRKKIRLNKGELPVPDAARTTALEPGVDCSTYTGDGYDINRDGVFNVIDYACDDRVDLGAPHNVNPDLLEPQDLLIAFSDGTDADHNGYVDDIAGWDFLDDDNDPFDDVQYGHGSGEARDSAAEADNGGELGACPNCTEVPLRVGTSFIADVNNFAMAVYYAVDNGASVVQEALGTLNKSASGRQATDYAFNHGTTIIASAADEAAQHNNWPSSYPHVIVVNSVTHTSDTDNVPVGKASSYLQFNGCTNFNAKVDLAIPSVSCSSDATGRAAGMAGLVYSAARNAGVRLSAGEVKQLMASGSIGGVPQADDVDFAQDPFSGTSTELQCPAPGCTDPFLAAPTTRQLPGLESYPARRGHDQFYGYGRANMVNALKGVTTPPPEVEVTSPEWFAQVDPSKDFAVDGRVWARGAEYSCKVYAAPGGYPGVDDFYELPSPVCNGTPRSAPVDGRVALVDVAALKAKFPPDQPGDFSGPEQGSAPEQAHSGRPDTLPYGFVVKIVATRGDRVGTDQRQLFLHRDRDALDAHVPAQLPGDGEASPLLADLDGDNRNELIIANSDGVVHAYRRDGSELPGFPVHGDPLPMHPGSPAVRSGAVSAKTASAFLASPSMGDLDHDGVPELVAADMEGKVYVWEPDGRRARRVESEVRYSGRPLHPFENVRNGVLNRTQLGFIGSPVLADIDGNDGGRLEIVAAAMDRHVYAWNDDGTPVPGFPVLVVDRTKVQSVDPETHKVTFKPEVPGDDITYDQGAIVDTPAVGDLDGDGKPEIVVGTNENYTVDTGGEGPLNVGANSPSYQLLGHALAAANGRLYALRNTGDPDGDLLAGPAPWLDGWPFRVAILQQGVLPLVGEGITGSPVIGQVPCGGTDPETVTGTIPATGVPYLVQGDGQSCYGRDGGNDRALPTDTTGGAQDSPFIAAFGHPAFGELAGGTTFLAPAAGLKRALDVVLPEYQRGGQDYLVGWETGSGQLRPGWPRPVNDLQFLRSLGRRHRSVVAGRGGRLGQRERRPAGLHVGRHRRRRLAEAHRRLDGRQPGDRLLGRRRAQGRRRAHP